MDTQHAPHLILPNLGIRELPPLGEVEKLLVGDTAPQEEGQAGRNVQITQTIDLSRVRPFRLPKHTQQEVRVAQEEFECELDSGLKAASGLSPLVKEPEKRLRAPTAPLTNDTPTIRGPAWTGTRTSSPSSAVRMYTSHSGSPRSPGPVKLIGAGLPGASPPIVNRRNNSPSSRTSTCWGRPMPMI